MYFTEKEKGKEKRNIYTRLWKKKKRKGGKKSYNKLDVIQIVLRNSIHIFDLNIRLNEKMLFFFPYFSVVIVVVF